LKTDWKHAGFRTGFLLSSGILLGLSLTACFKNSVIEPRSQVSENQDEGGDSGDPAFDAGDSAASDGDDGVSDNPLDSPGNGGDTVVVNPGDGIPDPGSADYVDPSAPPAGTSATGGSWVVVPPLPTGSETMPTLYDVEWGGGRFVAVGYGGTILFSDDGISWTVAASGTTRTLNAVIWQPPKPGGQAGRFVAVGSYGEVLTSPDGQIWALGSVGNASVDLEGVAWNGSFFVAAASRATLLKQACCVPPHPVTKNIIFTSSDAVNWTSRFSETLSGTATQVSVQSYAGGPRTVGWGGSGAGRHFAILYSDGRLARSANGLSWTLDSVAGKPSFVDMAWGGSGWVALALQAASSSSAGRIYASTDGRAWQVAGSVPPPVNAVIWTGSRFVAAGSGSSLWISEGSGWTSRPSGTNAVLYGLAHRPGVAGVPARLVAVGANATIVTSD
jgi:hypothetical protein